MRNTSHSDLKIRVRERDGNVWAENVLEHLKSQIKGQHNPQRPVRSSRYLKRQSSFIAVFIFFFILRETFPSGILSLLQHYDASEGNAARKPQERRSVCLTLCVCVCVSRCIPAHVGVRKTCQHLSPE